MPSKLGKNFIKVLSDENIDGYENGYITEYFLQANIGDLNKNFYICGPPPMMDAIEKMLTSLHVNEKLIIKDAF